MRKTVYFHVGLPKTGTTTVQQHLRDNEAELRRVGYLYPGAEEDPSFGGSRNHDLMMNAMTGHLTARSEGLDVEQSREAVERAFGAFRDAPDMRGLIWSQEAIGMAAPRWDRAFLRALTEDLDVAIVVVVRYTDDWIESLYREMIWARAGRKAERVLSRPMRPISEASAADEGDQARRSALEHGMSIGRAIRTMRRKLPEATIRVVSFDETVRSGRLVSAALEAFDVRLEGFFSKADADAGVRNPTKSTAFTMFLYQMITANLGHEHVRSLGKALRRRIRHRKSPEWLAERRLRFLPADAVVKARRSYAQLRTEFEHLPVQPAYVDQPSDHFLSPEESFRLLEWLAPDIDVGTYRAVRKALARCATA